MTDKDEPKTESTTSGTESETKVITEVQETRSISEIELVKAAYKKRYKWEVEVVAGPTKYFNGSLVAVREKEKPDSDGEICYVESRKVKIFNSTEDLVEFMTSSENLPFYKKATDRAVITAVAFILLLLMIFAAGFITVDFNKDVVSILGNVLGVAAGFYFGQSVGSR